MATKRPKVSWREVLTPRFWINYVVVLVATSWIPLTEMSIESEGVRQTVNYIPVYEHYQYLLPGQFSLRALFVVLFHLFLCFAISYWVWWGVIRSTKQTVGTPASGSDGQE